LNDIIHILESDSLSRFRESFDFVTFDRPLLFFDAANADTRYTHPELVIHMETLPVQVDATTLEAGLRLPRRRPSTILQVENLRKGFTHRTGSRANNLAVLDGISFDVDEGEFVTILGPSGCGKSTLLNIVAGMEPCDGGFVMVKGLPASPTGADTVLIFQEDALFPWLTVEENVAFGLRNKGLDKDERARVAREFIELVQLSQFSHSYLHQLSGGMKQRVAIARGLAINPRILLMDEPFGALDYRTREILQGQIQQIHEETKKTILFVTHDVREAVSLGDRVILMSRRPARIKRQYTVDLPRPRSAEDPRLQGVTKEVLKDLKEEVKVPGGPVGPDGSDEGPSF
jgi:NitT/TauT family transport system ATP-binding protein